MTKKLYVSHKEEPDLTMEEWNKLYPMECIKIINPTGKDLYVTAYFSKKEAVFLFFDKNLRCVRPYTPNIVDKKDIESIEIGMTLRDVEKLDPSAHLFTLKPNSKGGSVTDHFSSDGYVYTVYYKFEPDLTVSYIEKNMLL